MFSSWHAFFMIFKIIFSNTLSFQITPHFPRVGWAHLDLSIVLVSCILGTSLGGLIFSSFGPTVREFFFLLSFFVAAGTTLGGHT